MKNSIRINTNLKYLFIRSNLVSHRNFLWLNGPNAGHARCKACLSSLPNCRALTVPRRRQCALLTPFPVTALTGRVYVPSVAQTFLISCSRATLTGRYQGLYLMFVKLRNASAGPIAGPHVHTPARAARRRDRGRPRGPGGGGGGEAAGGMAHVPAEAGKFVCADGKRPEQHAADAH